MTCQRTGNSESKGKRGMTPDTALRLSELFKVSPEFWMNLQAGWDLWHAQHARKASGKAGSIKPIAKAS